MRRSLMQTGGALAVFLLAGCASWTPVHSTSEWTLLVKDGAPVDVARFERVLEPAFDAVEQRMGPFKSSVPVHAWDSTNPDHAPRALAQGAGDGNLGNLPGVGPARVRAFHVRGGSALFSESGIYLGAAEVGTAVHELVHARLAEDGTSPPLWFEEGLATFLGDGFLFDGRWVVDGLAYWPMRELRNQRIDDLELAHLLRVTARDDYDALENLLVHFAGWAIVFDLAREDPDGTWEDWLAAYRAGSLCHGELGEARLRLDRTLSWNTHTEWLTRLYDPDPGVRSAAAKGVWKLRSLSAVDALLEALEVEEHPEVRFTLAINAMLSTGEIRLGRERWWRMRREVFPAVRENQLEDLDERAAGRQLYDSMRSWGSERRERSRRAIERLSRFWEE